MGPASDQGLSYDGFFRDDVPLRKPAESLEQLYDVLKSMEARTQDHKIYTSMHALLVCWEDDDLKVMDEINALKQLLESRFECTVEVFTVPSQDSNRIPPVEFRSRLLKLAYPKHEEEELLIIYYAGHGIREGSSWVWFPKLPYKKSNKNIVWTAMQEIVKDSPSDALIILDSCYAGAAARGDVRGIKELLAACRRDTTAFGVCDMSFTSNLIGAIKDFGHDPFSVSDLSESLIGRYPDHLGEEPVYHSFSGDGESIRLTPKPAQAHASPPQSSIEEDVHMSSPKSSPGKDRLKPGDSLALFVAYIQSDCSEDDMERFSRKIKGLSEPDKQMNAGVFFRTKSTIVLMTLPISLWLRLSSHPACKFIAYVTSPNAIIPFNQTSPISKYGLSSSPTFLRGDQRGKRTPRREKSPSALSEMSTSGDPTSSQNDDSQTSSSQGTQKSDSTHASQSTQSSDSTTLTSQSIHDCQMTYMSVPEDIPEADEPKPEDQGHGSDVE